MSQRVPVLVNSRIVELADPVRAARIAKAPNAEVLRARRRGRIVRITLSSEGDDSTIVKHRGNPRRYSHDRETEVNPRGVWTLRHIPTEAADIFQTVVNECAA